MKQVQHPIKSRPGPSNKEEPSTSGILEQIEQHGPSAPSQYNEKKSSTTGTLEEVQPPSQSAPVEKKSSTSGILEQVQQPTQFAPDPSIQEKPSTSGTLEQVEQPSQSASGQPIQEKSYTSGALEQVLQPIQSAPGQSIEKKSASGTCVQFQQPSQSAPDQSIRRKSSTSRTLEQLQEPSQSGTRQSIEKKSTSGTLEQLQQPSQFAPGQSVQKSPTSGTLEQLQQPSQSATDRSTQGKSSTSSTFEQETQQYQDKLSIEKELFEAADNVILERYKNGISQRRKVEEELKSLKDIKVCRNSRINLKTVVELEEWLGDLEKEKGELETYRRWNHSSEEKITLEDILKKVTTLDGETKECRHAMFIAPAGMGKTTLLNQIAVLARQGKIETLKDKLILMPDLRVFSAEDKKRPLEALLRNMNFNRKSKRMMMKWIKENAEKVVFIIDGLDTLSFNLDEEHKAIGVNDRAKVEGILYNLFAKNLFDQSTIISSSRNFKVRELYRDVRPDRCVLLDGLSDDSVEYVLKRDLGKRATIVMTQIDTKCRNIWPLLTTPVLLSLFITLTCSPNSIANTTNSADLIADTMSGIFISFFLYLTTNKKIRICRKLNRLMPMSFKGIRNTQVLFKPEDLKQFGLTPKEFDKLDMFKKQNQGYNVLSKLMEKDSSFLYFNHQTQQECLAALYVLSKPIRKSEKLIKACFTDSKFSVVRRIICGILLNKKVLKKAKEITKIPHVQWKKVILLGNLKRSLKASSGAHLLDLINDLNECKDGVRETVQSLVRIDLKLLNLSPSDIQAVLSLIKQCEYLEEVNLFGCRLNEEKMAILLNTLMESTLKLKILEVSENKIGSEGMLHLGEFVQKSKLEELDASDCWLTSEHLEKFVEGAGNAELKILSVTGNNIGSEGMFHLGEFIQKSELEELYAAGCSLKSEHLKQFVDGAGNAELKKFVVGGNWSIGSEGMFHLGKFVQNSELEELGANQCALESEHLKKFSEGAGNAKLNELDVGTNPELGPQGMKLLGELTKKREVKVLGVSYCDMKSEHIENLAEGFGDTVIDSLDLEDQAHLPSYTRSLLKLLHHVRKKLNLECWQINKSQREEIKNELNKIGSPTLTVVVGDWRYPKDPVTHLKASKVNSTSGVAQEPSTSGIKPVSGSVTLAEETADASGMAGEPSTSQIAHASSGTSEIKPALGAAGRNVK